MAIKNECPNCHGELTSTGVRHCDPKNHQRACGWVKHRSCGAVVDPRHGRFYLTPEGPKS